MVVFRYCINCVGICIWVIILLKFIVSFVYNIRVIGYEFFIVRFIYVDVVIDFLFNYLFLGMLYCMN